MNSVKRIHDHHRLAHRADDSPEIPCVGAVKKYRHKIYVSVISKKKKKDLRICGLRGMHWASEVLRVMETGFCIICTNLREV